MKKQIKTQIITLCTAMLASACTQNERISFYHDAEREKSALVITAVNIKTETAETRATTFEPISGSSIGIFLSNTNGNSSYPSKKNVRYMRTATAWEPAKLRDDIYLLSDNANLCAYYPYSDIITDATKVSLSAHLLADDETPLTYATNITANEENRNVAFTMKQAYALLEINFNRNNIKDAVTLSEFSLVHTGLYKESLLNITNDAATNIAVTDNRITFNGEIGLPQNSIVKRNILLPPTPINGLVGGLKISVKVKEYGNRVLSITLPQLTSLVKGTKYAVTLTVDGTSLIPSLVEVLPWTITTINNGGIPIVPILEANAKTGIQVTESEIKLGGSNCIDGYKYVLSKLVCPEENLKSTGTRSEGYYVWGKSTEYAYYSIHSSDINGTTAYNFISKSSNTEVYDNVFNC